MDALLDGQFLANPFDTFKAGTLGAARHPLRGTAHTDTTFAVIEGVRAIKNEESKHWA